MSFLEWHSKYDNYLVWKIIIFPIYWLIIFADIEKGQRHFEIRMWAVFALIAMIPLTFKFIIDIGIAYKTYKDLKNEEHSND